MGAIKKKIKKLSSKNYFFRSIYNNMKKIKRKIMYRKMYKKFNVNEKMIIFESFWGKSYSCSPKAIYNYIIKQPEFNDFKFIWVFKDTKNRKNFFKDPRTEIVKYDSKKYYQYFAQAKYWVINFRLSDCIIKKKNQVFIQCWHGTPLKRLGCDIKIDGGNKLSSKRDIYKIYTNDAKKYDYFISPSKFCTEKFISAFNLDKLNKKDIIVEKGYPRNDFLYNFNQEDIIKIKEKLNLPKDKKIILYAPTYRDNQHKLGKGYVLDLQLDLEKLKKELGNEYVILMRLHYLVANKLDLTNLNDFAYDVSKYDDINELYIISDILVTDYSSVFFDYANLKRPIIFYMYDLKEYQCEIRDFYIDLDELPGPIIEREEDLINSIKNIKEYNKKYNDKYVKFSKKYNYLDDGQAAKRVVEECIKVNGGKQ